MLVDPRVKSTNVEGFAPSVSNAAQSPVTNIGVKIFWYTLLTLPLGLGWIWRPIAKNKLIRMQMDINEAASGIEVKLMMRKDTLVKLVDATKSSVKWEKEVLTEVTALRNVKSVAPKELANTASKIDTAGARIMATLENYPNLQSTAAINKLMETADYIEREIAASRRLYNSNVTLFNKAIFVFPKSIMASALKYSMMPLIEASEEQKKDVNLSF